MKSLVLIAIVLMVSAEGRAEDFVATIDVSRSYLNREIHQPTTRVLFVNLTLMKMAGVLPTVGIPYVANRAQGTFLVASLKAPTAASQAAMTEIIEYDPVQNSVLSRFEHPQTLATFFGWAQPHGGISLIQTGADNRIWLLTEVRGGQDHPKQTVELIDGATHATRARYSVPDQYFNRVYMHAVGDRCVLLESENQRAKSRVLVLGDDGPSEAVELGLEVGEALVSVDHSAQTVSGITIRGGALVSFELPPAKQPAKSITVTHIPDVQQDPRTVQAYQYIDENSALVGLAKDAYSIDEVMIVEPKTAKVLRRIPLPTPVMSLRFIKGTLYGVNAKDGRVMSFSMEGQLLKSSDVLISLRGATFQSH